MAMVATLIAPHAARSEVRPAEFLLDQPPVSLNPRSTLDATGQRLNNLLYSALTRISTELEPKPDLAESWQVRDHGREVHFKIREGLKDHSGETITAEKISACLENYRTGKPTSPYISSFPQWKGTRHTDLEVILELSKPDPFLMRNVSLLHYFRTSKDAPACSEPHGAEPIVGSGPFRAQKWDPTPETELTLVAVDPRYMDVHFQFVPDDNTRMLAMLRGKIDITLDSLGLAKERWLERNYSDKFLLVERAGTRVSYMAFNMRNPILARPEVRKAITLAIDRKQIVQNKMFGLASLAGSLLAPGIPEALDSPFTFDPDQAEKLLDQAGFPKRADGTRFELHYKTTPVREGFENALMLRQMLERIGIRVVLDVVEPAVFLQSVRQGYFDMYSSRWLGVADASILYRTLDSKSKDNRVAYKNPKMDELLESADAELDPSKRTKLLQQAQSLMAEELPYFPLWFWHVGIVVRKDHPVLSKIRKEDLSLTGALEPMLLLR